MERWWAHGREVYLASQKTAVMKGESVVPLFVAHSRTMAMKAATAHNLECVMKEYGER